MADHQTEMHGTIRMPCGFRYSGDKKALEETTECSYDWDAQSCDCDAYTQVKSSDTKDA